MKRKHKNYQVISIGKSLAQRLELQQQKWWLSNLKDSEWYSMNEIAKQAVSQWLKKNQSPFSR